MENEYIEVTGRSVDEALTNALIKLETTSDKVVYEVIDKGSNGLFGLFNSKPTKIKARKKTEDELKVVVEEKKPQELKVDIKKETNTTNTTHKSEPKKEVKTEVKPSAKVSEEKNVSVMSHEEIETKINSFLNEMFSAMDMQVNITVTFNEKEECVNVDLSGENMGVLIGKRGQTLDSIQYLTSLVLNKGKEKYVRIKLDTENYRNRRQETLESLAKNIASKVKRSRRSVSLEPMNPYERRIIHSALQNDKFVSTKSEGEEPFRHVVVFLGSEKNPNRNSKYRR